MYRLSSLDNFRVACNPLTGSIDLIRVGKDRSVALDKREAFWECIQAVTEHFVENDKGTRFEYKLGDQKYTLTVVPRWEDNSETPR